MYVVVMCKQFGIIRSQRNILLWATNSIQAITTNKIYLFFFQKW